MHNCSIFVVLCTSDQSMLILKEWKSCFFAELKCVVTIFLFFVRCHPLLCIILYVCLFRNALFKVAYHKQTDMIFFLLISALESGSMLNTFSRFLNLSPSCVSVTVTPEFIVNNTQRRRHSKAN